MRLTVPGPRDLMAVLERGTVAVEQLLTAAPRVVALLGEAERMLARAETLIDGIDATRTAADEIVEKSDAVVERASALVSEVAPVNQRLIGLVDTMEPPLTKLQPLLERIADTTDPHEIDALVQLIDHLPRLADKMETDIMPILDSLNSVAPDLHDLLDVSRELNEMLSQVPGLSRMKRRIDKEQAAEGRGQR